MPPLPDSVIVSMLRREALLTKAKLHHLVFEHLQQDKSVRTLKSQLKQVRRSGEQCVWGGSWSGGTLLECPDQAFADSHMHHGCLAPPHFLLILPSPALPTPFPCFLPLPPGRARV